MAQLSRSDNQAMLNLGKLSRYDAKLMIEIARDSRSVALSTARDSASMRILAIVTILFLPATFTAVSNVKFELLPKLNPYMTLQTFFSMTFFNFLDADSPKASPWIWIYVAATGLLTVIIQGIWAFMSHRSQAKPISDSQSDFKVMQNENLSLSASSGL